MIQLDLNREIKNIIKVIGVGGGGSNAVNHMFSQGITGVDFVVCNTDLQALNASPVNEKLPIGQALTSGLGAGSNPEVGEKAANESLEQIIEMLGVHTRMLFVTAGMGGGTGTGAAPVIARTARDMGILTVGIVTTPFKVEGIKRKTFADAGLQRMKESVDCLLVINNDKIMSLLGDQRFINAFSTANNILTTAARGIAEIITINGYINVDFEDVRTVMTNSGVALMGTAEAEGENRALDAIETALNSPLLNDNNIKGAKNILLNISSGEEEALMSEIEEITEYIQNESESSTDIILGLTQNPSLGKKIGVTIIATGFDPLENKPIESKPIQWVKRNLNEPQKPEKTHEKPAPVNGQFELFDNPVMPIAESIPQPPPELKQPESVQNNAEYIERLKQRFVELKNLNANIRNPQAIEEMHEVPAYLRKRVQFDEIPNSSETPLSRTSLIEDKVEFKHEIKPNNSFLHDNVD